MTSLYVNMYFFVRYIAAWFSLSSVGHRIIGEHSYIANERWDIARHYRDHHFGAGCYRLCGVVRHWIVFGQYHFLSGLGNCR